MSKASSASYQQMDLLLAVLQLEKLDVTFESH